MQHGLIDASALGTALHHQRSFGGRLGDVLVGLGLLREEQLVDVLGHQLQLPVARLGDRTVPPAVLKLVPERLLRRHHALPLWIAPRASGLRYQLVVAFADPQDVTAADEVAFAAGMPVRPVLAGKRELARALDAHFGPAPHRDTVPPARAGARAPVVPIELCEADDLGMVLVDVRERRLAS